MREPIAYHLTWTCYGQWLPGDARGFVDREHRTPDSPYAEPDLRLYTASANRMAEHACWLSDRHRAVAQAALEEACQHRGWTLEEVNVQPDHVHLALRAPPLTGKRAMEALKSWATMCLNRAFPRRNRWWTKGGKVELIYNEAHLRSVTAYIRRQRFRVVEASRDREIAGVNEPRP